MLVPNYCTIAFRICKVALLYYLCYNSNMSPIERSRRLQERNSGFNAAKRTKMALARTVDTLIASRPDADPEQMEVSAPLTMPDTVSDRLAKLILRHYPDEVTARMMPSPYDVSLSLDTEVEPPVITAKLSYKE
jgi:hypothetical protein